MGHHNSFSKIKKMFAAAKYSFGFQSIRAWNRFQSWFYERVWKDEDRFWVYVAAFVGSLLLAGLVLLVLFSGGLSHSKIKYNPYEVLGLDRNCTDKEIKSQYRRLSRTMYVLFHHHIY